MNKLPIKEISFKRYKALFTIAYRNNISVRVNCDLPEDDNMTTYFESNEGISYLKAYGLMGGLCRYKVGTENITDLHQQHRIAKGGYFLECFDTELVNLYEKNGFGIVGRLPFNEEFAHLAWRDVIPQKPDVVFLSLYKKDVKRSDDYGKLLDYTASTDNFRLFMSRPQEDKLIMDFHNLDKLLAFCNKTISDITSVVKLPNGEQSYSLDHPMNAYVDVTKLKKFKE